MKSAGHTLPTLLKAIDSVLLNADLRTSDAVNRAKSSSVELNGERPVQEGSYLIQRADLRFVHVDHRPSMIDPPRRTLIRSPKHPLQAHTSLESRKSPVQAHTSLDKTNS